MTREPTNPFCRKIKPSGTTRLPNGWSRSEIAVSAELKLRVGRCATDLSNLLIPVQFDQPPTAVVSQGSTNEVGYGSGSKHSFWRAIKDGDVKTGAVGGMIATHPL